MRKPYGEEAFSGTDQRVLLKGVYLRLLPRLLLIPLFFLVGALLGAAVYYCAHVIYGPGRKYAGGARLYLTFSKAAAPDSKDYYNAWTWKELITSDEILDVAMNRLITQGLSSTQQASGDAVGADGTTVKTQDDELVLISGNTENGITRAEVLESVVIHMPSDLRVMMLTVTNRDRERADAILDAMLTALTGYGETNAVFDEIRVLESTPALLLIYEDRTKNAVIFGGVLGAVIGLFILLLLGAMDDAVYDPESAGRRFDAAVLGVVPGGKRDPSEKTARDAERFAAELSAALEKHLTDRGQVAVLTAGKKEDANDLCAKLLESAGEVLKKKECSVSALDEMNLTGDLPFANAVLGIPCGKQAGARAEHLLAVLDTVKLPIAGIVLYDADLRYLRCLYGKW